MAEKRILNADLYDNVLTERPGDYVAKPRITGRAGNKEISERFAKARTEYRPETIENILNLSDDIKIDMIAEGISVVDGVGQFLLNLKGSFEGEKPAFDPSKHHIGVTFTTGKKLLEALDNITFNLNLATVGPVINTITEVESGTVNEFFTPGDSVIIAGSGLLIKGDDPSNGLFFTKDEEGATPVKATLIPRNTVSEIIAQAPKNLEAGQYRVSITTQSGASYTLLKQPRTYEFPILMTVKGDEDDGPIEVI